MNAASFHALFVCSLGTTEEIGLVWRRRSPSPPYHPLSILPLLFSFVTSPFRSSMDSTEEIWRFAFGAVRCLGRWPPGSPTPLASAWSGGPAGVVDGRSSWCEWRSRQRTTRRRQHPQCGMLGWSLSSAKRTKLRFS